MTYRIRDSADVLMERNQNSQVVTVPSNLVTVLVVEVESRRDSNGISVEKLLEDPFDYADYMAGVFDVNCAACEGSGKMLESHIKALQQAAEDRQLAAMEDGNYEAYQGAGDWRWGT
jgi:hypothetical protein